MVPGGGDNELTTCVRRFGRLKAVANTRSGRSEHITGARMSAYNGHEVILYLFVCHLHCSLRL